VSYRRHRPWTGGRREPANVPLSIAENYFTRGGALWRWKGLTSFLLRKLFILGQNDQALAWMDFAAAEGAVILREFSQVDWDGVKKGVTVGFLARDFPVNQYDDATHRMYEAGEQRGLYFETTAHTFAYDMKEMVEHLKRVDNLAAAHPNVVLEIGNEPPVNGIDVDELARRYTPRTLWTHGGYDPFPTASSKWVNDHPPRDDQFARKFKGGYEYFKGEGPYVPFQPPFTGPVILDEPERMERRGTPDDWRAFGAGTAQFCAGGTAHGGLWAQACQVPTDADVLAKLRAFMAGMDDVPLQCYFGYEHPSDNGSLRRYRRRGEDNKNYEISVRPYEFKVV
jgi:hypothetical protein